MYKSNAKKSVIVSTGSAGTGAGSSPFKSHQLKYDMSPSSNGDDSIMDHTALMHSMRKAMNAAKPKPLTKKQLQQQQAQRQKQQSAAMQSPVPNEMIDRAFMNYNFAADPISAAAANVSMVMPNPGMLPFSIQQQQQNNEPAHHHLMPMSPTTVPILDVAPPQPKKKIPRPRKNNTAAALKVTKAALAKQAATVKRNGRYNKKPKAQPKDEQSLSSRRRKATATATSSASAGPYGKQTRANKKHTAQEDQVAELLASSMNQPSYNNRLFEQQQPHPQHQYANGVSPARNGMETPEDRLNDYEKHIALILTTMRTSVPSTATVIAPDQQDGGARSMSGGGFVSPRSLYNRSGDPEASASPTVYTYSIPLESQKATPPRRMASVAPRLETPSSPTQQPLEAQYFVNNNNVGYPEFPPELEVTTNSIWRAFVSDHNYYLHTAAALGEPERQEMWGPAPPIVTDRYVLSDEKTSSIAVTGAIKPDKKQTVRVLAPPNTKNNSSSRPSGIGDDTNSTNYSKQAKQRAAVAEPWPQPPTDVVVVKENHVASAAAPVIAAPSSSGYVTQDSGYMTPDQKSPIDYSKSGGTTIVKASVPAADQPVMVLPLPASSPSAALPNDTNNNKYATEGSGSQVPAQDLQQRPTELGVGCGNAAKKRWLRQATSENENATACMSASTPLKKRRIVREVDSFVESPSPQVTPTAITTPTPQSYTPIYQETMPTAVAPIYPVLQAVPPVYSALYDNSCSSSSVYSTPSTTQLVNTISHVLDSLEPSFSGQQTPTDTVAVPAVKPSPQKSILEEFVSVACAENDATPTISMDSYNLYAATMKQDSSGGELDVDDDDLRDFMQLEQRAAEGSGFKLRTPTKTRAKPKRKSNKRNEQTPRKAPRAKRKKKSQTDDDDDALFGKKPKTPKQAHHYSDIFLSKQKLALELFEKKKHENEEIERRRLNSQGEEEERKPVIDVAEVKVEPEDELKLLEQEMNEPMELPVSNDACVKVESELMSLERLERELTDNDPEPRIENEVVDDSKSHLEQILSGPSSSTAMPIEAIIQKVPTAAVQRPRPSKLNFELLKNVPEPKKLKGKKMVKNDGPKPKSAKALRAVEVEAQSVETLTLKVEQKPPVSEESQVKVELSAVEPQKAMHSEVSVIKSTVELLKPSKSTEEPPRAMKSLAHKPVEQPKSTKSPAVEAQTSVKTMEIDCKMDAVEPQKTVKGDKVADAPKSVAIIEPSTAAQKETRLMIIGVEPTANANSIDQPRQLRIEKDGKLVLMEHQRLPKIEKSKPTEPPKGSKSPVEYPKAIRSPVVSPKTTKSLAETQKPAKFTVECPKAIKVPVGSPKATKSPTEVPKPAKCTVEYLKVIKSPVEVQKRMKSPVDGPKVTKSPVESPIVMTSPVWAQKRIKSPVETPKATKSPLEAQKPAKSPAETPPKAVKAEKPLDEPQRTSTKQNESQSVEQSPSSDKAETPKPLEASGKQKSPQNIADPAKKPKKKLKEKQKCVAVEVKTPDTTPKPKKSDEEILFAADTVIVTESPLPIPTTPSITPKPLLNQVAVPAAKLVPAMPTVPLDDAKLASAKPNCSPKKLLKPLKNPLDTSEPVEEKKTEPSEKLNENEKIKQLLGLEAKLIIDIDEKIEFDMRVQGKDAEPEVSEPPPTPVVDVVIPVQVERAVEETVRKISNDEEREIKKSDELERFKNPEKEKSDAVDKDLESETGSSTAQSSPLSSSPITESEHKRHLDTIELFHETELQSLRQKNARLRKICGKRRLNLNIDYQLMDDDLLRVEIMSPKSVDHNSDPLDNGATTAAFKKSNLHYRLTPLDSPPPPPTPIIPSSSSTPNVVNPDNKPFLGLYTTNRLLSSFDERTRTLSGGDSRSRTESLSSPQQQAQPQQSSPNSSTHSNSNASSSATKLLPKSSSSSFDDMAFQQLRYAQAATLTPTPNFNYNPIMYSSRSFGPTPNGFASSLDTYNCLSGGYNEVMFGSAAFQSAFYDCISDDPKTTTLTTLNHNGSESEAPQKKSAEENGTEGAAATEQQPDLNDINNNSDNNNLDETAATLPSEPLAQSHHNVFDVTPEPSTAATPEDERYLKPFYGKIFTKTASNDPRLNPSLSSEPKEKQAPTPKKKVSVPPSLTPTVRL